MPKKKNPHLIVDLFAGPGGLGEGFLSLKENGASQFKGALSIEHDESSHATLTLRHFVRAFPEIPEDYYHYLEGVITLDELYRMHPDEHQHAADRSRKITLGAESHADVTKLLTYRLRGQDRWALIGGPPCQAYSLVGRSRMARNPTFEQDERHFLYREYLKILADHRPPVFVMENVKGLLSAKIDGVSIITRIVSDLQSPTYALRGRGNGLRYRLFSLVEPDEPGREVDPKLFIVRAEQYGVPQARHRMFIVGIRSDIDVRPELLTRRQAPSVGDVIGDLPVIRSKLSREEDTPARWREAISSISSRDVVKHLNGSSYTKRITGEIRLLSQENIIWPENSSSRVYTGKPGRPSKALSQIRDPNLNVLNGHDARSHMASDLRRYMYAAVFANVTGSSPRLSDFPSSLLPSHGNVELGVAGQMFSDRFRVQLPDHVSTTITSHISKDGHYFIHYDPIQCRSLTVREAARLQTFPDNYCFLGTRTSQYHQVGNAVPPHLALQIAEIVNEILDSIKEAS